MSVIETSSELPCEPAIGLQQAGTYHGSVRALLDDRFVVVCPAGLLYARLAASCLLQPGIGDRVLVSSQAEEHYVLAVLQQANPAQADVRLGADVRLRAGSLQVETQAGLSLAAGQSMSLHAQRAVLRAREDVALEARALNASAEQMQLAATVRRDVSVTRHDVAAHMQAHYGDSVHKVDGHEEQVANSLRIVVAREWRVRADRADVLAQRRIRMDADRVDIG